MKMRLALWNNTRRIPSLRGKLRDKIGDAIYADVCHRYPQVAGAQESLDAVIRQRASVGRYGDGEYKLCRGRNLRFQPTHPQLVKRMREVLVADSDGFYAAVLPLSRKSDPAYQAYLREKHIRNSQVTAQMDDRCRLSAHMFAPFWNDGARDFVAVRKIWDAEKVVVVGNEEVVTALKKSPRFFDGALGVKYVVVPRTNAFAQYDTILAQCNAISGDKLFLLACGPTATVLAYDLHKSGRWAVDVGHFFARCLGGNESI